jgi:hypothetical protein
MRLTGRKPRLTREQYRRILRVMRIKRRAASLPTQKQLAREMGVSYCTIHNAARYGVKHYADVGMP